jgi:hypothetical protein
MTRSRFGRRFALALVGYGNTPLMIVGSYGREGIRTLAASAVGSLLGTANYYTAAIGHIYTEDGAPHTIDTSGSSSLGWLAGTSIFANAGTIFRVGLASGVDTTAGPPARPATSGGLVTYDVYRQMVGGSGDIVSGAWNENVPTSGSKTIANGDLVAFVLQMIAKGGSSDIAQFSGMAPVAGSGTTPSRPTVGSVTASAGLNQFYPNCAITFSDGTKGYFVGGFVYSIPRTILTWNNTSTPKEYGNYIQAPFACSIHGIAVGMGIAADVDLVLYSDPLGTPVAERTISVDANAVSSATVVDGYYLFSQPFLARANQPLAVIMKPGATSVTTHYLTVPVGHQKAHSLGASAYGVNRDTGSFAAQNSSRDRFGIGAIIAAVPHHARPSLALGI